MSEYIAAAFDACCDNAVPPDVFYVSLYVRGCVYGGPEEGGWWRHPLVLQKTQRCVNEEQADLLASKVRDLAENLTRIARSEHGRAMLESMEWLDARGLDADFLPEPDGPDEYVVIVERTPGESASDGGPTHYE